MRQALGGIGKSVERFVKRTLKLAGLAVAGLTISLLGIAFVAMGIVKWFTLLIPSWLAWLVVGIILLLLGVAVTALTLVTMRS